MYEIGRQVYTVQSVQAAAHEGAWWGWLMREANTLCGASLAGIKGEVQGGCATVPAQAWAKCGANHGQSWGLVSAGRGVMQGDGGGRRPRCSKGEGGGGGGGALRKSGGGVDYIAVRSITPGGTEASTTAPGTRCWPQGPRRGPSRQSRHA